MTQRERWFYRPSSRHEYVLIAHAHQRTRMLTLSCLARPRREPTRLAFVHDLLPSARAASGVIAAWTTDGVIDWILDSAMTAASDALRAAPVGTGVAARGAAGASTVLVLVFVSSSNPYPAYSTRLVRHWVRWP